MNIYDLPIAVCHPQWALDIVLQVGIPTAIAQGNWQGETALLRSDGTEVPISQVIVVHRDADNNIAYLSTVVRDISHIKRMEAELRDREQQFRNMADYAPVMIWKCDAEQQCDYLSQSWYAFTGFAPGTGLGQAWLDSVHPDDRAQLWDKERAAQLDQQPFRLEYRLRHHTGEYRWVIDAARPWRGVDGEFKGYIGSIIDISDRKRIEAELRDSEQQFRTMADYAPMMVWKCDQHGACNYLSQSWYAFTGLETPFGLGKTWINAIHPEERDRICQTVQVAHTAQSSFRMEYRLRHHTGDYRWVMDAARPWLGSNGEFKGYIGSIIDISDLKQTEADLRLSEERYRSLTSILTSIVWTTDAEGAFTTPQIEWQAYTGQRWETAQGFGWAAALHPDDRDQVVAAWLAAKEQLTAYQAEGRIWHAASQSYHYFEARAVPLFHANGTVREWVGNVTDCHEIKLAEAARLQSEANLRSVLENMPVMLDAFDESGNITVWNQECERVTGYSAADMIGNPHAMQLLYPDRDYLATMQQQWAAVGNDYRNWEWHLVAKNGEIKTVAWSNISDRFPISDWGIWGVGVDVTERQRAKQEIIALNQSLEERVEQRTAELLAANQELEAFSYSVSHDLRAPLRSISGFSEILQEDYATQLDEEGLRYLDRIQQGAQRMSELINDLLMLSRITRSELMHTRVNLSEMTREICQTLHNTHQNRRVNWCVDSQVQAIGDQRLLRIALENLLSNAWKFTVHQPEARIEFGTLLEDQAEQPVYFIRDNGVGFDMSYANKLFTAFQRLHSDQEFSGTGIGLAIVQRVIHRHGGRVWAEAAPNAGATFYFSLPSAQSSAPAQ